MTKLLYAGFDALEVAFQGALPPEILKQLEAERTVAEKAQTPQLVTLGPGAVEAHLRPNGMSGGYAFVLDTGPTGESWRFKNNIDASQWNISVAVHTTALISHSFEDTRDRLLATLKAMGCKFGGESVRRVDFAMDFLMPEGFEPDHMNFVAPGQSKAKPHYGEREAPESPDRDPNKPTAVFGGRQLETITIGSMPGRQVTLYNKRRAAIAKRQPYWFKLWGLDPQDRSNNVWRVEIRAPKKELKDKWRLTTFQDIENAIGDVMLDAVLKVRYVEGGQRDSNVSRLRNHPLWDAVTEALSKNLLDYRCGLQPCQLRDVIREQQSETYMQQIQGLAAGLSVTWGLSEEEIRERLGTLLGQTLANRIDHPETTFWDSRRRAGQRLAFI